MTRWRRIRAGGEAFPPFSAPAHEPGGARLIASSKAGAQWLRKWTATDAALDDLLPMIAPGDQDDGRRK